MAIWRRLVAFAKLFRSSFSWSVDERIEQAFLKKKEFSARVLASGFISTFVIVAAIVIIVVVRTHSQIGTESRLMLRERGDLIAQLLGDRLDAVLERENRRSFSHYRFMMIIPSLNREDVVLSPLAQFPVLSDVPGLIGYFQIDPDGSFHTPVLPEGLSDRYPVTDRSARTRYARRLEMIVRQGDLTRGSVVERVASNDLLAQKGDTLTSVDEEDFNEEVQIVPIVRSPRIEEQSESQRKLFDAEALSPASSQKTPFLNVEIYPFYTLISSRYMLFQRDVMRGKERYVQGFVVSILAFFTRIFQNEIAYDFMNDVGVRFSTGSVRLLEFGAWQEENESVRYTLAWPFHEIFLDIAYRVPRRGEATAAIALVGALFLIGFGAALMLFYRAIMASLKTAQKRGDFISAVTHELKTPLTGIITNIELLSGDYPMSDADKKRVYHRIDGEAARLSRLIENVLNISRLERRQLVVQLSQGSIDALVRQFADQLGPVYQNKGFELRLDLTVGDQPFLFSPDAMTQVLVNVVDNAVKFAAKAEIRYVELRTQLTKDGGAMLTVRDYGTGVPEEDLTEIFRAFYRAESEMVRSTLGTGIGLSLVKGFCDLMRIKLEVRNAHPGFEVRFLIPPLREELLTANEEVQQWGD